MANYQLRTCALRKPFLPNTLPNTHSQVASNSRRRRRGTQRRRRRGTQIGALPGNNSMEDCVFVSDGPIHARVQNLTAFRLSDCLQTLTASSDASSAQSLTASSHLSKNSKAILAPATHNTCPVQKARKFSAVRGTRCAKSSMVIRPSCSRLPCLCRQTFRYMKLCTEQMLRENCVEMR